jgi:hypothetical protein
MADIGYVRTLLAGIKDDATRRILNAAFEHVLSNIRLGVPEHHVRATNLQAYFQKSTTASDTSEFSIAHGLPSAPHWAIPVLDLSEPGSKAGGFTVSRAADMKRIYLKADAGSTGVPITLLSEW